MPSIFKIAEGVPCRACGAVLAAEGHNDFGICHSCWVQVLLFCGVRFSTRNLPTKTEITAEDVNQWLAGKLVLDLKRLRRTGFVGRCEALSGSPWGHPGTQCAHVAAKVRDGHQVCAAHFKATSPIYVSERRADKYEMMRDILSDLVKADLRFARVLIEVAMAIDEDIDLWQETA